MGLKNKVGFRSEHLGGVWDEPGGEKCGVAHKRRARKVRQNLAVGEIPQDGVYRYLGVAQLIQPEIKGPSKERVCEDSENHMERRVELRHN